MVTEPLKGIMTNYTYDSRNRLTGAGNLTYTYDAENNRIAVTDSVNGTTGYVINLNSVLSQVLIKTDPSGNKTYYVYGLGLIGQEDPDGTYRTYHFDRRGSTVALTDQTGTVTDRYQYTAYGELVYQTGTTATLFLFNGRYGVMTDDNGLYYMRARYYNPEIKRFINQDVLLGDVHSGQSQNRYAYANGNPVSYLDPFGLSRDSDGMLDNFQTMLDFAGMVPGIGEAFDGLNALIYFGRGDYKYAAISVAAMVGVGEAAKILKLASKFGLDAGIGIGAVYLKSAGKAGEQVFSRVKSYEQARNKALNIVGDLGADSKPFVGRLGTGEGTIVGRQSADGKVRWRLDYDPQKGPHINVEDFRNGKGSDATKIAIPFEGDMSAIESMLKHLNR